MRHKETFECKIVIIFFPTNLNMFLGAQKGFFHFMLNPDVSCFENRVDLDQLATVFCSA